MKKYFVAVLVFLLLVTTPGFNSVTLKENDVAYPEGYRHWTHVKSGFLGPDHPNVNYRGFNHIYANVVALRGYESGTFPEGSIIVADIIEAVAGGNHFSESKRNHMDVMEKDSVRFRSTGGWGYGQFESNNTPRMLTVEQKKTCYNCHLKQEDHVFSVLRE